MRYFAFLCTILLLATPVWGLSLATHTQMQEHISVLNQTDYKQSNGDNISSHVESLTGFENYLQGSAYSSAESNGSLSVSTNVNTDVYDGTQTFFYSTAEWSETFINDSLDSHYYFEFTLADILYGGSWMMGTPQAGFEVDVLLNGDAIFEYSFLFDTTELFQEVLDYIAEQQAQHGSVDVPMSMMMADYSIPDIVQLLDLGYFGINESFTLTYAISSYVYPVDSDSAYSELSMSGNLFSSNSHPTIDPVPEPATLLLLVCGGFGGLLLNRTKKKNIL